MSRHARKILNLLTLAAFTVSCTDATEPESIDVASQVVLTEPPYRYETGGFDERWMWSFESTLPQVRLSRRTSTDGQDLAIPGAPYSFGVLKSAQEPFL